MDQRDAFAKLLAAHSTGFHAFAFTIFGKHEEAEEVLQKASVIMWEKFGTFKQGTSFGAWGRAVLTRVAWSHARAKKRQPVLLEEDVLERLADAHERVDAAYRSERMVDALHVCIRGLPENQRRMLNLKYCERKSSINLAEIFRKSVQAIDVALFRIRKQLEQCIRLRLSQEEVGL
ncbi:MAG: sigma-70 family RNA polymerase sigma factor [Kiritimatiellae bacterium]|nr:sigma-70 family RNA polymerase sigma factor [Kiritimatiellia bacterium]